MDEEGVLDGTAAEGVGLALAHYAFAAVRPYQAVSSRLVMAEYLNNMGTLSVIVMYACSDSREL